MRRAAGDAPEEALPISGKPSSIVARRKCTVAEKVKLSGVPETMLQTVYARAKESGSRGAIHDAKAEEIVGKLDYDFALADKDAAMHNGVIARTIVLDRLTKNVARIASRRSGHQYSLRA